MKQVGYEGRTISLEEAERQVKGQIRETSMFVTVLAGDKVKMQFTGKVYQRHAFGGKGNDAWEAESSILNI